MCCWGRNSGGVGGGGVEGEGELEIVHPKVLTLLLMCLPASNFIFHEGNSAGRKGRQVSIPLVVCRHINNGVICWFEAFEFDVRDLAVIVM